MHVLRLDVGASVDKYVNRIRSIVVRCRQEDVVDGQEPQEKRANISCPVVLQHTEGYTKVRQACTSIYPGKSLDRSILPSLPKPKVEQNCSATIVLVRFFVHLPCEGPCSRLSPRR